MNAEALEERIQGYCRQYKVASRGPRELPPYPAGERETRQHRDWIVLYKALARYRRRQAGLPATPERLAALERQKGRCPICLDEVGNEGVRAHHPQPGAAMSIVHPACNELLRLAAELGPKALDRLRPYLWPVSSKKER